MQCVLCNVTDVASRGDICPSCNENVHCGGCQAPATEARSDEWEGSCTKCGENHWRFETPPVDADPPPQRIAS